MPKFALFTIHSSMKAHIPAAHIQIAETSDMEVIHGLAHAIWRPTYQEILSQEQVDYMLEQIYDVPSLKIQQAQGQTFLLLKISEEPAAFAAFSPLLPEEQVYKLNKIYFLPKYQGMGMGKRLLEEVVTRCKALGGKTLELNVHRDNPAQHFYRKHGFSIVKTVDIPFGPFTLNDYIMRRSL